MGRQAELVSQLLSICGRDIRGGSSYNLIAQGMFLVIIVDFIHPLRPQLISIYTNHLSPSHPLVVSLLNLNCEATQIPSLDVQANSLTND